MTADILGVVVANLLRNARRTTLLAAPILVGTIVLQGVFIGALEGGNQIRDRFEGRGGDVVTLRRLDPPSPGEDGSVFLDGGRDVAARAGPYVEGAGAMVVIRQPAISLSVADTESSSVELRSSLILAGPGVLEAAAASTSSGRLFGPADETGLVDVALVGAGVARHYGLDGVAPPTGVAVLVDGTPVRVIGVLKPSGRLPELDNSIVLPAVAPVVDGVRRDPERDLSLVNESIIVRATSISVVEDAAAHARSVVRSHPSMPPMQADFDGALLRSYSDGLASLLWSLLVAGGLGAAASLASCTYLQTSSIKLRRPELGLRLALGAPPAALRAVLWLESMALGIVCWAVTAVPASILVGRGARPTDIALMVVGSLVLTLFVATVLPARWIGRLMDQSPAGLLGS